METKWRASTWGEEISLEYGKAIRGYGESSGKFRVFGSNGPIGWTENSLTNGPGVILGRKGAYRGVQFSRDAFWVIDTAYYVVPKADLDMRWLYYAVKHYKLGDIDDGSPIPSTTRAAVYVQNVVVPPREEQYAIAAVLGALDDRIENLRESSATLEAIATALFRSWFVDFDGAPLEKMQDSELGPIPNGWRIEEIGKLVTCLGGATPSTGDDVYWQGGTHHWATPKDLSGLQAPVLLTTARLITDAGVARISSGLLPEGTLLMSSRAPIGYLAITSVPVAINQGFIAIPPGGALSPTWLLFWAKEDMEAIKQKANGSTFLEISKAAFRPIKVVVPPTEILNQFEIVAGPTIEQIKCNERHIALLAGLRDILLPRLINGQLRMRQ